MNTNKLPKASATHALTTEETKAPAKDLLSAVEPHPYTESSQSGKGGVTAPATSPASSEAPRPEHSETQEEALKKLLVGILTDPKYKLSTSQQQPGK